ncbi:MAG: hypothetical protein P1U63_08265 [Coxiellaceae bacterium]|nr:hypothetical protein [Coxiellaceae bacterium]
MTKRYTQSGQKTKHKQAKYLAKHAAKQASRQKKQARKNFAKPPVKREEDTSRPEHSYTPHGTLNISSRKSLLVCILLMLAKYTSGMDTTAEMKAVTTANMLIHSFQMDDVAICNKPKRGIQYQTGYKESGWLSTQKTFVSCSQSVGLMRSELAIARETKLRKLERKKMRLPKHCDMNAAKNFANTVIAIEHSSSYAKKHKATHCGELADRVLTEFLTSEDPELRKHPIGKVILTHPHATDNHAFNIIFSEHNAPEPGSIVEDSFEKIVRHFPDAHAVDLWNHISLPLSHFNSPEKFKQSITEHMPYTLYNGEEVGTRLPLDAPVIQAVADEYSEKVRAYYHDLSHCEIRVMPREPTPECTIDISAFKA